MMRIEFLDGPRKGETVDIDKDTVVIGRDRGADVTVEDEEVSREHAELSRTKDGAIVVRDLDSQNGTRVDRSKVAGERQLAAGDKVRIGKTVFSVEAVGVGATRIAGESDRGNQTVGGTRLARGPIASVKIVAGEDGGKTVDLTRSGMTFGRDSGADVQLNDDEASRAHAELKVNEDGRVEVTDLGSRNGTSVNGKRISKTTLAADGDEIGIGQTRMSVSAAAAKGPSRLGALTDGALSNRRTIGAVIGAVVVVLAVLLVAGVFSGGSSGPLSTPDIVKKVQPSTVQVLSSAAGRRQPAGSGWILDPAQGLVVTNAHVVEEGENSLASLIQYGKPITNYSVSVNGFPRHADVYAVAPCEDLAILRVGGLQGAPAMQLGSQSDVQAGEKAVALGFPGNAEISPGTGIPLQTNEGTVSVPQTRADDTALSADQPVYSNVVQMDTAINPGNSGGPLVNDRGQLIGVNTLGSNSLQNQNYAIGVDRVKQITDQMRGGNSIGWAGIGFIGLGDKGAGGFPPGLFVTSVFPGTGSDQGGLQPFDVITNINGTPVSTRGDYCNATQNLSSGESTPIQIVRYIGGQGYALQGRITFQ